MLDQESKDYIEDVIKEAIGIAGQSEVDKGCNDNMKPFYEAFNKMQADLKGALADSKNPFFKSTYANLESVIGVARQPMADNGLAFSQSPDKTGTLLVTKFVHESGAFIKGYFPLTPKDKGPQGFMSALTYARRGALSSMLGIHATDDDGNEANERQPGTTVDDEKVKSKFKSIKTPKAKSDIEKLTDDVRDVMDEKVEKISDSRVKQLSAQLEKLSETQQKEFLDEMFVTKLEQIRKDEYVKATRTLKKVVNQ